VCSELEERQVSSSISNTAAHVARQARLMTVSVAAATSSVLQIQYLHLLMGVKFPHEQRACGTCVHTLEDTTLMNDWLHSAADRMTENTRSMYSAHRKLNCTGEKTYTL